MFKKQHLLLGVLFLGMSIKPIYIYTEQDNFGRTIFKIMISVTVVLICNSCKTVYDSYYETNKKPETQKNLTFAIFVK